MAGRIDFFCAAGEERTLLDYVLAGDVVGLEPRVEKPDAILALDIRSLPAWPAPSRCYLWLRSAGPLHWHTAPPGVKGETHGELVANVLVAEAWERRRPEAGEGFIDVDRSPLLVYERPGNGRGPLLPSALVCPASSPDQVSSEYAGWVRKIWAWIRRRATRVHDWRERHPRLRNDLMILSSVYAFPEALARLDEEPGAYAISVR